MFLFISSKNSFEGLNSFFLNFLNEKFKFGLAGGLKLKYDELNLDRDTGIRSKEINSASLGFVPSLASYPSTLDSSFLKKIDPFSKFEFSSLSSLESNNNSKHSLREEYFSKYSDDKFFFSPSIIFSEKKNFSPNFLNFSFEMIKNLLN
jgi:hypothetical protein